VGAVRYSQYDFFKRIAIKFIASQRGQKTGTSRDHDLTDYPALEAFAEGNRSWLEITLIGIWKILDKKTAICCSALPTPRSPIV
jgi:hypothetical protein